MTRTTPWLAVGAAAVGTAALLLGIGTVLGPDQADDVGSPPPTGSAGAPTDAPAPDVSTSATPRPPGAFDAVPAGIGLDSQRGADGGEIEITVTEGAAAWVLPLCDVEAPPPEPVDALTTVEIGPEYARHWQVAVMPGKAEAAAVLAAVTAVVEGCSSSVGGAATVGVDDFGPLGDLTAGDASLLAVARPAGADQSEDSEWRSYLGAVRVDNVVILVAESGEFHAAPALDDYGMQAVQTDLAELLDGLCGQGNQRCRAEEAPVR